jgi:hypothetical protein
MEQRAPSVLVSQAEEFLANLGSAQALAFILSIDPTFAKFLEQECGLDLSLIEVVSNVASKAAGSLHNRPGVVTIENAQKWLEAQNANVP